MRKALIIGLSAMLACGCASKKTEVSFVAAEPEFKVNTNWLVQPELELDEVMPIRPSSVNVINVTTSRFGELTVRAVTEVSGSPAETYGYTNDAIIVRKDEFQGIYSYEGEELYPIELNRIGSPYRSGITSGYYNGEMVYGFANTGSGKAKIFARDFRSCEEVSYDDFIFDPFGIDTAQPFLAVVGGSFGVVAMTTDENGARTGWAFEALDPSVLSGRTVVYTVDGSMNKQSQVIYNPLDQSIIGMAGGAAFDESSFVNGYYVISDAGHATLVEANSASGVAVDYQDAMYYEDGYAPVEMNNKWGFVDGSGNEVTDFMFDSVTPLANGKTFAGVNGKYGVVDVKGLLESGRQVNFSTLNTRTDETKIGRAKVNVRTLLAREDGNTNGRIVGVCASGSVYDVFEKAEADGYTWYRVSDSAWIASEGSWVTYEGE